MAVIRRRVGGECVAGADVPIDAGDDGGKSEQSPEIDVHAWPFPKSGPGELVGNVKERSKRGRVELSRNIKQVDLICGGSVFYRVVGRHLRVEKRLAGGSTERFRQFDNGFTRRVSFALLKPLNHRMAQPCSRTKLKKR